MSRAWSDDLQARQGFTAKSVIRYAIATGHLVKLIVRGNHMDTTALANDIAAKVVADSSFWVALIGLIGVVAGALITVAGSFALHWIQDLPLRRLDLGRKNLLEKMLRDPRFKDKWRKIETLSRVIGTDEETTKRLLIEVGARGSEKDDGFWGLIENHPLEQIAQ